MKHLTDFSEDISKCSKCGMCQAVCPLYKLTGNDCAVSRGKFVMLDGVVKGDLSLNKNINRYLEMCLKCGKCTDFCPSGIDVCKIFRTAKHEYIKNSTEGFWVNLLFSEHIFDNVITTASKFNKFNEIKTNKQTKKLLFFKGCANNVMFQNNKAIEKIFSKLDYTITTADFKCCGVPFLSAGNLEKAEEAQKYNTNLINNTDCDFVITDCASCQSALTEYPDINKKIVTFAEFFTDENISFDFEKPVKVTFHKPCHFKNYEKIKTILNKCKNVEYIEMQGYDECCGLAGQFAITNRKYSVELSKIKAKNADNTGADIILTACPACELGLRQGFIHIGKPFKKIMNITEFLSMAINIK